MRAMKIGNAARWRNWARALSRRGVSRRRSPLSLAFVRRAQMVSWISSWNNVIHKYSVVGGPLSVQANLRVALVGQIVVPVSARAQALANDSAREPAHTSALESTAGQPSKHTLLRDIVERTRRIEQRVQVHTHLVSRPTANAAGPEVERALHAKRTSAEWWNQDFGDTRSHPSPPQPTVNVEQITDSVLRQLDRRVGAWRERMGRM